jgi:hypothetical protein
LSQIEERACETGIVLDEIAVISSEAEELPDFCDRRGRLPVFDLRDF